MKIGFIGIGNMGGAILAGYANSASAAGSELMAYDPSEKTCSDMKAKVSDIRFCRDIGELCRLSEIIFIGVKPQIVSGVLEEMAQAYTSDKTVVSMVTGGVTMDVIAESLGKDARIIRIMPNTPASVGEAMTAVCRNSNITDEEFAKVKEILDSIGITGEIDESLMGCAGGVSGSSPAYTYMYIEALMQAAMEYGMPEKEARIFAAQAVSGAAKMVLDSNRPAKELREDVCSPGGVTIEAVNTLLENGFMDDVKEGFRASMKRFREINAE